MTGSPLPEHAEGKPPARRSLAHFGGRGNLGRREFRYAALQPMRLLKTSANGLLAFAPGGDARLERLDAARADHEILGDDIARCAADAERFGQKL